MTSKFAAFVCYVYHCVLHTGSVVSTLYDCSTGVGMAVVDEEDMGPLGADHLFDASYCAELLTHTTTIDKTHRPPSR